MRYRGGDLLPVLRGLGLRTSAFFSRVVTMKLSDQVAVVTGAGRNIGEAVSKTLAGEGAKVTVVDLDKGRAERVAAEICKMGGEAAALVADVSAEADIAALVEEVVKRWGHIDILVNNAAISDNKNILEITKAEWDAVLAVTLTGPFLMAQHVARQMVAQGSGGRIVNVGSTSGFFGRSRAIAYSAAKGGVANLTRAMAVQLAPHGIRVNGVVPNKIGSPVGKDEFDPTRPVVNLRGRPGVPLDMARAILFLVSEDSDFVAGTMLYVDGGVSAMMVGDRAP
jgi:NAD(P)-dependent dehydrogenase (short-subunit alcohol dehydrogenase family)